MYSSGSGSGQLPYGLTTLSARTIAPSVSGMATSQVANVVIQTPQHDFIRKDAPLNDQERKYCRCLLEVESKGRAYSPYGVCTRSVGAQVHSCSPHYDWGLMDLDMLIAYMTLHKIDITGINTREQALMAISQWKTSKGESM